MAGAFRDFDAAWAEDEDEPVVVRLLGEEWKCRRPSEVPAALLLKMDRLLLGVARQVTTGEDPDLDFEVDALLDPESILRQMAGDDNVDTWLARGLPYQRLMDVSRYLTRVYRGQPDEGEAPAANRAQRRAAARPQHSRSKRSSRTGG